MIDGLSGSSAAGGVERLARAIDERLIRSQVGERRPQRVGQAEERRHAAGVRRGRAAECLYGLRGVAGDVLPLEQGATLHVGLVRVVAARRDAPEPLTVRGREAQVEGRDDVADRPAFQRRDAGLWCGVGPLQQHLAVRLLDADGELAARIRDGDLTGNDRGHAEFTRALDAVGGVGEVVREVGP